MGVVGDLKGRKNRGAGAPRFFLAPLLQPPGLPRFFSRSLRAPEATVASEGRHRRRRPREDLPSNGRCPRKKGCNRNQTTATNAMLSRRSHRRGGLGTARWDGRRNLKWVGRDQRGSRLQFSGFWGWMRHFLMLASPVAPLALGMLTRAPRGGCVGSGRKPPVSGADDVDARTPHCRSNAPDHSLHRELARDGTQDNAADARWVPPGES
jgi:hypothetical protein